MEPLAATMAADLLTRLPFRIVLFSVALFALALRIAGILPSTDSKSSSQATAMLLEQEKSTPEMQGKVAHFLKLKDEILRWHFLQRCHLPNFDNTCPILSAASNNAAAASLAETIAFKGWRAILNLPFSPNS